MPYCLQDRIDFLERLSIPAGIRILDLGPDGWLSRCLARYLGLSCSCLTTSRYLEGAKLICGQDFQLICWNPPKLPFKLKSLDLVMGYHSLHLLDPRLWPGLLAQIHGVLKPAGRLGLMMFSPLPSNPAQQAGLLGLKLRGIPILDPDQLLRLLAGVGFEQLKLELVQRQIQVPPDWIQWHVQAAQSSQDEELRSKYLELIAEHGEQLPQGILITGSTPT